MLATDDISFENAFKDRKWKLAMMSEYTSLIENKTWELAPIPPNQKAITCKWVFKIEQDGDENDVYKARLVAKGFVQKRGVDYHEGYAPTVRLASI